MDVLDSKQTQFGFGVDPFNPRPARPVEAVGGDSKDSLRRQIVESCPRVPGVYGMLDRTGDLIYVGKSKSLRSRLLSYFAASNEEEKGGRLIESARAIQWETQPSEFAALLREQQLIRQFSPRWNVQGVPKRQRPVYLCLGRAPAAQFFLAPKPPKECQAIQGPFFGAKRMGVAVDTLNKVFQLRDCSQKQTFQFAEQLSLFEIDHRPGCLRLELGTCLGPCAAACTQKEYANQVDAAQRFLSGATDEPLLELQQRMESASRDQQYELAGKAYQSLRCLQYVHRKLTMLATARRSYNFVYAVPGYDGCHTWYLIHCGEVSAVAATPVGRDAYRQMKPMLSAWKATLESSVQRGHGPFPYTLGTVASWFRQNRAELKRSFSPSQAGRKYHRRSMVA
ncbi:ethanolamine utilization protein [Roseiconus nitratireducens]|uniref:Ethanolamine utilization protein n=1 Tax=Roseiconus nitratireducens TaxID=2605748 RepID=A0A5M6DEE9_9BACT|nr:GIY-YIG nuclease family protein [Roseiconus nitratireducens]KAA5545914.1 ethanolamine utilization protein [Roseiconus nitratireducens]